MDAVKHTRIHPESLTAFIGVNVLTRLCGSSTPVSTKGDDQHQHRFQPCHDLLYLAGLVLYNTAFIFYKVGEKESETIQAGVVDGS